jgi:hypothetical protein
VVLMALGAGMIERKPRQMAVNRAGQQPEITAGATAGIDIPPVLAAVTTPQWGMRRMRPSPKHRPDITLEDAIRLLAELERTELPAEVPEESGSPVEMQIVTHDPDITITVVQESKGGSL